METKIATNAIAWMIRRARRSCRLSQKELAEAMAISPRRIARVERKKAQVTATEWFLFCKKVEIFSDSLQFGYIIWSDAGRSNQAEIEAAKREIPDYCIKHLGSYALTTKAPSPVTPGIRFVSPQAGTQGVEQNA